jgi:hypothetical protein
MSKQPITGIDIRRELSWAEFDARITSSQLQKFFGDFHVNQLEKLWKAAFIHVVPPCGTIHPDSAGRQLIYVVALGAIKLWPDTYTENRRVPFAYNIGDIFFPGDSLTADDLKRACAIPASTDVNSLVIELDQAVYAQLVEDLQRDRSERIRRFVYQQIWVGCDQPPDFSRGPPSPDDETRHSSPAQDIQDKAMQHLIRIFSLRRLEPGVSAVDQGSSITRLVWVERGVCLAVIAFSARHCTAESVPGVLPRATSTQHRRSGPQYPTPQK